ncbi:rod-binding protein [Sulfitobacter pseudonitzschiae]|uniref:Rod-binding protein n=1 Tax=Pseudosulfitobacter pseudonitzschiae TaxID=1402135 RepID=A0A9Q2NER4_9RHOB|nr:rod-binding protein [Pseudosulfitobacter pseudonitzschiae]MBM2290518.1 rod-binding protein [Pseudosulfitobacter pseudonitzschiae]MBM2295436.1 rod-binding protein [Pseudosulfitobacter pseudonitzschiae]MBM2300348.1 rod-binding protein [Pseudosulfitobacter pseudonitzschiae]MBM2310133.1 rod-binding protein [Pseudosulfitobacter pseudonitzschiae]MBM2315045.1 rod-binding protein [Pseudosulfitobacter pseudonitzschiae]
MQVTPDTAGVALARKPTAQADAELRAVADQLEAGFLAEMLKSAGFGQARDSFGGGEGEDQFSSFLVQAQAEKMVAAGGIGLSESLFQALKGRTHEG